MKRLGEGDEGSLPQTVLAKYEGLASIYQNMYQDRGTSGHPDSEMPLYLKMLLPVYDGWCFSPEWEAPRPVELWSGAFMGHQDALGSALALADRDSLQAVERRILRRSTTYRLILHGERLLRQAIEEATFLRSPEAQQEAPSPLSLDAFSTALETAHVVAANGGGMGMRSGMNLSGLRTDWLFDWADLVRASAHELRKREHMFSRQYRVERAIRSQDIDDAYGVFLLTSVSDAPHHTDLLGRWYRSILRRCAATEGDLERILRVNVRSAQRRAPKVLTPDRLWGRIAQKKLADHQNYLEKREKIPRGGAWSDYTRREKHETSYRKDT